MASDTQIIVKHFCSTLNIKTNSTTFTRFLGQAKNLLKDYTVEEVIKVIDFIAFHPPVNKITSIAFLPYIMEETLPKAIAKENKYKTEVITERKDEVDVTKINEGKYNKSNNSFANRGNVIF